MAGTTERTVQASNGAQDAEVSERPVSPPGGASDGENERTAREKLKKTSIAGLSQHSRDVGSQAAGDTTVTDHKTEDGLPIENGIRGRPSKKRSFEDIKDEQASPASTAELKGRAAHKRMRSREITHDGEVALEYTAASPLQEESDDDALDAPGGPGVMVDPDTTVDTNAQTAQTVEEKILEKEDTTNEPVIGVAAENGPPSAHAQEPKSLDTSADTAPKRSQATIGQGSGFANTSSSSPFGTLKSPTKDTDTKATSTTSASSTTSSSAFASSGLAAFASQSKSPFGASASTKSTGGFGDGSSGFGSGGSTFGKSSSGFGSGGGFGSGAAPSSFGGPSPSPFGAKSSFGSTSAFGGASSGGFGGGKGFGGGAPPKPFGGASAKIGKPSAKEEGDEEGGSGGEEEPNTEDAVEEEKQDSRFHKQDVETGEEGEETIFSARAKLYHYADKQWKERGTGVVKVNIRQEKTTKKVEDAKDEQDLEAGGEDDDFEIKARVIMRSDGVHRVVLNSPVFKGMEVGTQEGDEPTGKTMYLSGMDDGKPRLFQIKMGKEDMLRELYYRICEFRDNL